MTSNYTIRLDADMRREAEALFADLVEVVEGVGDVEAEFGAVDGVARGVVAVAGGVGGAGGGDGGQLVGVVVHSHRESSVAARRKPQGPSQ